MLAGIRVFATSRNIDTMQSLAEAGIETLALDVTDSASIRKAKAAVAEHTGHSLNVLVNNV